MGQFDSVEELAEHFKCMPILGSESGKYEQSSIRIKMLYYKVSKTLKTSELTGFYRRRQ